MPVAKKQTSFFTWLVLFFFVIVFLGMIIGNSISSNSSYSDVVAAAPSHDPASIIQRCGKPDRDQSTANDDPRPPIVSRIIGYKKQGVNLLFFPSDSKVGAPPPYDWKLLGTADYKTKKPITVAEAHKRLVCW